MGGVKKKPLSAVEKALRRQGEERERRRQRAQKEAKARASLSLEAGEDRIVKAIEELRAVTVHGLARALGVKASIANTIIKGYESKGLLERVGGWSGHYVWRIRRS